MIKLKSTVLLCNFIILCAGSVFVHSQQFTDPYIVPKWLFSIMVVLVIGAYCSLKLLLSKSIRVSLSLIGISVVVICFLLAVYGLLQYLNIFSIHIKYGITGSYDNPAGFASTLCAGLPFIGFLSLYVKYKYIRFIRWGIFVAIVAAVILSQSRAGIFSIAVVVVIHLFRQLREKKVLKYLLLCGLFLSFLYCYWMKKDSADGRLLIWRCGVDMVEDAPWTGHGVGSFEARYMDYQAAYFRQHKHDCFSMLAGNVKQPFNEFLKVLFNFGILGLVALFTLIGILVYCYQKNPDTEKKIAFYSLILIGVFSLFSYPFTYPFVWIITIFDILIIMREYLNRYLCVTDWARKILCIFVLISIFAGSYKLLMRIETEIKWNALAMSEIKYLDDKDLLTYAKLKKRLGDNPYFLYNYAVVLLEKEQYEESLQISLRCRRCWADYDLELLIGENYQRVKRPVLAEKYYNSALMMCPSKFTPLYKLFSLYKEYGEEQQACDIAKAIIRKPMKIATLNIRMIKKEMEREVRRRESNACH